MNLFNLFGAICTTFVCSPQPNLTIRSAQNDNKFYITTNESDLPFYQNYSNPSAYIGSTLYGGECTTLLVSNSGVFSLYINHLSIKNSLSTIVFTLHNIQQADDTITIRYDSDDLIITYTSVCLNGNPKFMIADPIDELDVSYASGEMRIERMIYSEMSPLLLTFKYCFNDIFTSYYDYASYKFSDGSFMIVDKIALGNATPRVITQYVEVSSTYWTSLWESIFNFPHLILGDFLNFEVFGINLQNLLFGIITFLVVLYVVKKVIR